MEDGHKASPQPVDRLLAAAEAYKREVDRLRGGWDMESYSAASALFDTLRGYWAAQADVHAGWVEVLLTRFEFTQALWESRATGAPTLQLDAAHERHASALQRLMQACMPPPRS